MPETQEPAQPATQGPRKEKPVFASGQANPASAASRLARKAELDALRAENADLRAMILERERAEADRDTEGGQVTSARMRKVMGQRSEVDSGPTEAELRKWLVKDVRNYVATMDEKERAERGAAAIEEEVGRLRKEVAELREAAINPAEGPDAGSERSLKLIEEYFENPERWEKP